VAALLAGVVTAASAHDLFIKLHSYFLEPDRNVEVLVLNGTFLGSENSITPDRLLDVSVVSPAGRDHLDTDHWIPRGDTTYVRMRTGESGTYVLGASTKARELDMSGEDFNEYLEHDGIPDVLMARERDGELNEPARERYAKHVKAVFQVGSQRSDHYSAVLGYPAEVIPLDNPYAMPQGSPLRFRCLVDGKPVANQLVIAGGEANGSTIAERSSRTDSDGVVRFTLDHPGKWYVKFISMVKAGGTEVDYVSKWATLTVEVR
jgi:hypothetical protein